MRIALRQPPADEQCSVLADGRFALKMAVVAFASARLCPAEVFGNCHCLNVRSAKNNRPSASRQAENKTTVSDITGRAGAKATISILYSDCSPAAAGGRAMLGLGRRPIRVKTVRFYIASARLYPAVLFEIFHYKNDSVNKNPAPVGAAIGRPLLPQGRFGTALKRIFFAGARPVILANIFTAYSL